MRRARRIMESVTILGFGRLRPAALKTPSLNERPPCGWPRPRPRLVDQLGKFDFAAAGPFRVSPSRNDQCIVVKNLHRQVVRGLFGTVCSYLIQHAIIFSLAQPPEYLGVIDQISV